MTALLDFTDLGNGLSATFDGMTVVLIKKHKDGKRHIAIPASTFILMASQISQQIVERSQDETKRQDGQQTAMD